MAITEAQQHIVAFLLLLSRLGDIGTTWLVSPTLKLETNPLVRRLKWPYALATLLLALVPYWWVPAGVGLLVPSLLAAASNGSRVWFVRLVGEDFYLRLMSEGVARARPLPSLFYTLLPAFFFFVLAGVVAMFYPNPDRDWGFWIAVGIFTYALALAVYGPLSLLRLKRLMAARAAAPA